MCKALTWHQRTSGVVGEKGGLPTDKSKCGAASADCKLYREHILLVCHFYLMKDVHVNYITTIAKQVVLLNVFQRHTVSLSEEH